MLSHPTFNSDERRRLSSFSPKLVRKSNKPHLPPLPEDSGRSEDPSAKKEEDDENSTVLSLDGDMKAKKRRYQRRTFDMNAWSAINSLRHESCPGLVTARVNKLRENMVDPLTFGSSLSSNENSGHHNPHHYRQTEEQKNRKGRWTFDHEEAMTSHQTGRLYGNVANEMNSIYKQLKEFETEVLEEFRRTIGCEKASILFVDHGTHELVVLIASQIFKFPMDSGIGGYVATSGESVNIPDCYQDSRFNADIDKKTGYKTRNMLAHAIRPKMGAGKIVGIVEMINKYGDGPFTEHDETVLSQCTHHVADALSNRFSELRSAYLMLGNYTGTTADTSNVKSRYLEPKAHQV